MTVEQKTQANLRNKKWKEKNREKVIQYKRKHYYDNHAKFLAIERERSYKKLYGISIEDYNEMSQEQNHRCKICLVDRPLQNEAIKRVYFCVDHDHVTGKVRGLLCTRCNSQLGWFEKYSKEIINYLK